MNEKECPLLFPTKRPPRGANKWHTSNVKRIKTMIRDFSLVFLLMISDRRNLHRDSRRDTEQNVPWGAHFGSEKESLKGLRGCALLESIIVNSYPSLLKL